VPRARRQRCRVPALRTTLLIAVLAATATLTLSTCARADEKCVTIPAQGTWGRERPQEHPALAEKRLCVGDTVVFIGRYCHTPESISRADDESVRAALGGSFKNSDGTPDRDAWNAFLKSLGCVEAGTAPDDLKVKLTSVHARPLRSGDDKVVCGTDASGETWCSIGELVDRE
jgi:hypothetical protein